MLNVTAERLIPERRALHVWACAPASSRQPRHPHRLTDGGLRIVGVLDTLDVRQARSATVGDRF